MNKMKCFSLAVGMAAVVPAMSAEYFHEDFRNYGDVAPGVTEGFEVVNDPIHRVRAEVKGAFEADTDVFARPIALPKAAAYDVAFDFSLNATNSALDVVFADANGKATVLPLRDLKGWRNAVVKVADGQLRLMVMDHRAWTNPLTRPLPKGLRTVNFRVKAGGAVSLTNVAVRDPQALRDFHALDSFADLRALQRPFVGANPSDGTPVVLADEGVHKSVSFKAGSMRKVGQLVFTWKNGTKDRFPICVTNQTFALAISSRPIPELGVKPKEKWCGRDSVVSFGSQIGDLYVRPSLVPYTGWWSANPMVEEFGRDWEKLPSASQHVTKVAVSENSNGWARVWIDGSLAYTLKPRRNQQGELKVGSVEITLENGVACRFDDERPEGDALRLDLSANPRAKAFADAVFEGGLKGKYDPLASADVGLAHVGQGLCGYEVDAYTRRKPMDGFPSAVHYRVPAAGWTQAELVFALDEAADKVPYLTVRLSRNDMRWGVGTTLIEDSVLDLTKGIPASVKKIGEVRRKPGEAPRPVYRATVDLPLGRCADFMAGDFIDLEFTGPMRDNLQQESHEKKPQADVSSAFNLFDVRLRRLDVVPTFVQATPGNVFTHDETGKKTSVALTALADGASGTLEWGGPNPGKAGYSLAKGATKAFDLTFADDLDVGLYKVPVTVRDANGQALTHVVRVCVTPDAGRLADKRATPYATWWFTAHGSPDKPEIGGPIMRKAGIGKASSIKLKKETCEKYGITCAGHVYAPRQSAFDVATGKFKGDAKIPDGEAWFTNQIARAIAQNDFTDRVMVWHESAPRIGIPEEILGLAAPTNDVEREKLTAAYLKECARILRKHFPQLKIQVGNTWNCAGAVAVPLRGGADLSCYDTFGMENPSQTIPPERLIDCGLLGMNITKAVAEKLGGRALQPDACYEFTYRQDRDLGWRGETTQAELYVRDILVSLMNGFSLIAPGLLFDCRNAYTCSLWGVSGILGRSPYVYPKEAYLAYAVLTKVLDGVKFVREVPTGSWTVYAAEFTRLDGKTVTAFWCARGEAELKVGVKGEVVTMLGKTSSVGGWFGLRDKVVCGTSPVYVVSEKPVASVEIVGRTFADDARIVAKGRALALPSAAEIEVAPDPEAESKHHDFLPYLKPGAFTVRDVEDDEEGACLEIALQKGANVSDFTTEYTTLRFKTPIPVEGSPATLGARVKGDSNWGQVRFEIEDAKGEVFKNLSTGRSWGCDIQDWPGYLAVNFDGWGDVYQYTDRNAFDLALSPGPRSEQWRSCGGDKKIDFPIKVRAITIGVNGSKPTIFGFDRAPSVLRLKRLWEAP